MKAYLRHIEWCVAMQRQVLSNKHDGEEAELRGQLARLTTEVNEYQRLLQLSTQEKAQLLDELQVYRTQQPEYME